MSQNTEILIALVTIIVTLFSFFHVWLTDNFKTRSARRERTSSLFRDYFSSHNFSVVVQPVFILIARLRAEKDDKIEAYWQAILAGWKSADVDAEGLARVFEDRDNSKLTAVEIHFDRPSEAGGFSEHESLTVFLHFWTVLYGLWNNRLVDEKLAIDLFSHPWCYYRSFLLEMCERLERENTSIEVPTWVHAVRFIDEKLT